MTPEIASENIDVLALPSLPLTKRVIVKQLSCASIA